MALSGDTRTREMIDPDAMGVSHVAPPYAYRCPFGSASDARVRRARGRGRRASASTSSASEQVAAVIIEPNAGSNGIVAPDTYWPAVRAAHRGNAASR